MSPRVLGTDPAAFGPPWPWRRFGLYLKPHDLEGCPGQTQRSLGGLSDEELAWLARCTTAELVRRRRVQATKEKSA